MSWTTVLIEQVADVSMLHVQCNSMSYESLNDIKTYRNVLENAENTEAIFARKKICLLVYFNFSVLRLAFRYLFFFTCKKQYDT